jgi:hypothetical protein
MDSTDLFGEEVASLIIAVKNGYKSVPTFPGVGTPAIEDVPWKPGKWP